MKTLPIRHEIKERRHMNKSISRRKFIQTAGAVPLTLSAAAVRLLRQTMGYGGIIMTDAMNMGGIGRYSEEEAAYLALRAGVDIILHPSSPEKTNAYLRSRRPDCDNSRLLEFRKGLLSKPVSSRPPFSENRRLCRNLSARSIAISGRFSVTDNLLLILLNDEEGKRGSSFEASLRAHFPSLRTEVMTPGRKGNCRIPPERFVIVAIFSETRAWKGGTSDWLMNTLMSLRDKADLLVSFGSPYILRGMGIDVCFSVHCIKRPKNERRNSNDVT